MKPQKIFECACQDGFKGDFCEFKTEQNHISIGNYIINTEGGIESTTGPHENWDHCVTMFKGEAIIFHHYNEV